ncbi:hypothetical protein IIB49_01450 [Patescibacteria group bacterium]|nr:hypothetical protein [Patescibacteria group bacterium]
MKNYELTLIVSAEDVLSRIGAKVQESDGIVSKEEMKGNNVAIIVFTMQPEKLEQLQAILKEDAGIKRHMLLVKPQRKMRKMPSMTPIIQTSTSDTPEAQQKVEIGEIDKKLEEIFKE